MQSTMHLRQIAGNIDSLLCACKARVERKQRESGTTGKSFVAATKLFSSSKSGCFAAKSGGNSAEAIQKRTRRVRARKCQSDKQAPINDFDDCNISAPLSLFLQLSIVLLDSGLLVRATFHCLSPLRNSCSRHAVSICFAVAR